MEQITKHKSWKKLESHFQKMTDFNLRAEFEIDQNRFNDFSIRFKDILFDYSKNLISAETMELLFELANGINLVDSIEQMFNGGIINNTEKRAVLHTSLRNFNSSPVLVDSSDVMQEINQVRDRMKEFVRKVHSGEWKGCTGEKVTDIINIGIGGSDLGPAMVCHALTRYSKNDLKVHFVSNVDGANIFEVLQDLNPEKCLFIVASKTFTTQETITNALTAKKWLIEKLGEETADVSKHFIALSTNQKAVNEFGINTENMFGFWNWVGGRYSLWSAIGMPIALYLGMENFEELLRGAYEADLHFRYSDFDKNIPVIMALIGIWYNNFYNARTYAVIPYDQYLNELPDYLQQLDMESNGKSVARDGTALDYSTGPVIWGKPGTNAQHSFFQLIHQGTQMIPADFLAPVLPLNDFAEHHDILISNFLAQTEALMRGKSREEVIQELKNQELNDDEINQLVNHKVFPGNRPTNSFFYKKLTPRTLGTLLAFYEHKVFVQGKIWGVNSFDQWGVELGKQLAKTILSEIEAKKQKNNHDSSTSGLMNYYISQKNIERD